MPTCVQEGLGRVLMKKNYPVTIPVSHQLPLLVVVCVGRMMDEIGSHLWFPHSTSAQVPTWSDHPTCYLFYLCRYRIHPTWHIFCVTKSPSGEAAICIRIEILALDYLGLKPSCKCMCYFWLPPNFYCPMVYRWETGGKIFRYSEALESILGLCICGLSQLFIEFKAVKPKNWRKKVKETMCKCT